ncbi:hypothetical protein H4F99_08430 [Lysobacter sp. SG-8]|uniref:Tetratricopeptide repeat protein n=1 Tax=Marilutibacter penaei TaxID=2759900 RepID=A0A7W3U3Z7_9GAMM|nr:hypothetical protein [Lysobacter penaei]MBB1088512.1 hypothetical protein [Lysobacter penaei]
MFGGLTLILAVALLAWWRQPLADWLWPGTRAQQLLVDAARALDEGRLSRADGSGARELYEAAQALDPDRLEAREGLQRVGLAALTRAEAEIAAGRLPEAHAALRLARELQVPRDAASAVERRLRAHEAASVDIETWLVAAGSALRAGDLVGHSGAALPMYRQVLQYEPANQAALEGREDALTAVIQQAWRDMAAGELARAGRRLAEARRFDPGHVDLPGAMAEWSRQREAAHARAGEALSRGRRTDARALWHELLRVDARDPEAREGLVRLAREWKTEAERAAADFRFEQAEAALDEARVTAALVPDARLDLDASARRIEAARDSQRRADGGGAGLTAEQREEAITRLLAQAAGAQGRGDVLSPPGESAYDRLAAARALAPDDPRVQAASARLAPASAACFEDALRANRLARAGHCLQAMAALGHREDEVVASRRRLAARWIAVGDERLGAGELERARTALEAATALDAHVEGLDAFAERVRAADITP